MNAAVLLLPPTASPIYRAGVGDPFSQGLYGSSEWASQGSSSRLSSSWFSASGSTLRADSFPACSLSEAASASPSPDPSCQPFYLQAAAYEASRSHDFEVVAGGVLAALLAASLVLLVARR